MLHLQQSQLPARVDRPGRFAQLYGIVAEYRPSTGGVGGRQAGLKFIFLCFPIPSNACFMKVPKRTVSVRGEDLGE
jgi:hypothetical protein